MKSVSGKWSFAIGLALAAVLGACALAWRPIAPRRTAPVKDATPVGSVECAGCHESVQGHERIAAYHGDCESCHGSGSLHAESQEPEGHPLPDAADCLACHEQRSRHASRAGAPANTARAGLLCSDCHKPHEPSRHNAAERRGNALAPRSAAPPGLFLGDERRGSARRATRTSRRASSSLRITRRRGDARLHELSRSARRRPRRARVIATTRCPAATRLTWGRGSTSTSRSPRTHATLSRPARRARADRCSRPAAGDLPDLPQPRRPLAPQHGGSGIRGNTGATTGLPVRPAAARR